MLDDADQRPPDIRSRVLYHGRGTIPISAGGVVAGLAALALLGLGAGCTGTSTGGQDDGTGGQAGGAAAGSGGKSVGGSSGGAGGTSLPRGTGGVAGGSGGTSSPLGTGGAGGSGGNGSGGAVATGGAGGHVTRDHCVYGYDPEPTDLTMKSGPAEFYPPGNMDPNLVDLTVQPEVLSWMKVNFWEATHVEWHAIRTCGLPGGSLGSQVNICSFTNLVPKDQNCQTPGDGYQFLLFHRHMLQSLKQLWPLHAHDFDGFPTFPQSAADVPAQWRGAWLQWNSTDLAVGKMLDQIDKPENLAKFPDEGTLGFYLQCQSGIALKSPPPGFTMKSDGIHFDLHAKWVRNGNTTHGVGNTSANVDNYMFWKLHGWIDNVWEKYRVAKGLKQTDQKYKDDMAAQCREMDTEESIVRDHLKPVDVPDPLPIESGFFHEKVRPIFEAMKNRCSGCHAETAPEAGQSLGGAISSKKIVANLVNVPARGGGQYMRVKPGKPDESWLYLKITGQTSTCMPTSTGACSPGVMPPDASGALAVGAGEAAVIRQWITDGALGPP